ncbi:hypothetical protein B0J11DRAFT_541909 [Dendryphion nanum]|uniref:Uncharacterized protein n=1 Tax=Dendryphion nanum TaxID=256645 RepID=A0A9P9I9R7_9PLEO|nr:hypothetical protein B0J11DRAFT_541909 [Dendryphion nanum]
MKAYLPAAGYCSVVISAACHPPHDDLYTHLNEVQWGALPMGEDEEVGHCTFPSGSITLPTEGRLYA